MIQRHGLTPIMHRVVEHDGLLFVGGIAASDLSAGMEGQTTQILNRLGQILAEVGSSKEKVLSATVYIADFAGKADMNKAWVAYFGPENLPTRATIGVNDLGEGLLLEVVVTAAR